MKTGFIFLFLIFLNSYAQAQQQGYPAYPSALSNHNLIDEIQDQPDRLIPKAEWATFSVDGHTYLRSLGRKDFYHGIGYWVQARSEIRPTEFFTLNVRSIFYSGSVSGGYVEPTGTYHLVGLTGVWPEPVAGGTLMGRAMDLERQTMGYGLMIEEKEMAGALIKWTRGSHSAKLILNGTGGLTYTDDLWNTQVNLFDGYLGFGAIYWSAGSEAGLTKNRDPLYYLTSGHDYEMGLGYFLEIGSREDRRAGLAGLKLKGTWKGLTVDSRVQARHYDKDFANTFKTQIQNVYISYDQYNKRYTNASNVFVTDDDVNVYSMVLDLTYEISPSWVIQSLNEVGRFDFKQAARQNFLFYRAGVTYFPIEGRREALTLFMSNKVLNDSYNRPPTDVSVNNIALFRQVNFFGAEGSFRF
jgi:hypothetical protein